MAKTSVKCLELATFSSGDMTAQYQSVNAPGFSNAIFHIRIVNDSNQDVFISYDGIVDHDYIPSNSTMELSSQNNSQPNAQEALFALGTQVYVAGTAGDGLVAVTGYYV